MNISYSLLQFPSMVLLAGMMLLFASLAGTGTYLVRTYFKLAYCRSHNEVVSYIFTTLGGFYGLLLGFIVLLSWDSMTQAQADANREGSLAKGLYRDIHFYPDSGKMAPLVRTYLQYAATVVQSEYPAMEQLKPISREDRSAFNNLFSEIEQLNPYDPRIEQMFRHLNELSTARSLRILDADSEIPEEIWTPLIIGAIIVLCFAMFIEVDSSRLHIITNSCLGTFLGLVIYLIVVLDHPFTGEMRVKPTEYKTILDMFPGDQSAKHQ